MARRRKARRARAQRPSSSSSSGPSEIDRPSARPQQQTRQAGTREFFWRRGRSRECVALEKKKKTGREEGVPFPNPNYKPAQLLLPPPAQVRRRRGPGVLLFFYRSNLAVFSLDRFAWSRSPSPVSESVYGGGGVGGWKCSRRSEGIARPHRRRAVAVAALQAEEDGAGQHGRVRARQERRRGGRRGSRPRVRLRRQQGRRRPAALAGPVGVARRAAAAPRLARRLPRHNRPGTPAPPATTHTYSFHMAH